MSNPYQPSSLTTDGVQISVQTLYVPEQSNPDEFSYVYAYQITIRNEGDEFIQLLHRHWDIFELLGETRVVEGEGVAGLQPILAPGEEHTYVSGCVMNDEIGKMSGYYTFIRPRNGQTFVVPIPAFTLMVPFLGN